MWVYVLGRERVSAGGVSLTDFSKLIDCELFSEFCSANED